MSLDVSKGNSKSNRDQLPVGAGLTTFTAVIWCWVFCLRLLCKIYKYFEIASNLPALKLKCKAFVGYNVCKHFLSVTSFTRIGILNLDGVCMLNLSEISERYFIKSVQLIE